MLNRRLTMVTYTYYWDADASGWIEFNNLCYPNLKSDMISVSVSQFHVHLSCSNAWFIILKTPVGAFKGPFLGTVDCETFRSFGDSSSGHCVVLPYRISIQFHCVMTSVSAVGCGSENHVLQLLWSLLCVYTVYLHLQWTIDIRHLPTSRYDTTAFVIGRDR